jgi:hypothetical protein
MLTKFLHVPLFIASLIAGFLFLYFHQNDHRTIIIYPSPDNHKDVQYKDPSNTFFEFKQTETECPVEKTSIQSFIVQQNKV